MSLFNLEIISADLLFADLFVIFITLVVFKNF